jgi:hypothetical protein
MYNKPKQQSITIPVGANISGGVLSPPRSYSHPLKHRNQTLSPSNSATPITSQKENVTTNFVFKEDRRKIRRTKQQQVQGASRVVSPESPIRTTQNQKQNPKGKQPKQQQQKEASVPPLLQVVRSDRPTILARERSTSWSSAGESTSISSLSNSFDRHINNANRLKQQREQLTSAMTAIFPYVDCYQSLAKLTSPTAAIADSPVNHQKKSNRENVVKSPASATAASRSISWWDEPESAESGEDNDHRTAAKNGRMNERLNGFSKKGEVSSDLSPTSFLHSSSATTRRSIKLSYDSSESETIGIEEDMTIDEYNVPSTLLSPSSRQNRKDVKPARLIIEKDESIVDVICNATSRIFQHLCAA